MDILPQIHIQTHSNLTSGILVNFEKKIPEKRTHKGKDSSPRIFLIAVEVPLRWCFREYQFDFSQIYTYEGEGSSLFKV